MLKYSRVLKVLAILNAEILRVIMLEDMPNLLGFKFITPAVLDGLTLEFITPAVLDGLTLEPRACPATPSPPRTSD